MNLWMNEGVRRGSLRRLSCASHSSSLVALAWLISLWVKGCCGSHCSAKRETSPSKQSNPPNLINSNHSIIIHSYFDSLILPRCVLFAELSCYYNSIHRFESFIYCYNIILVILVNQWMEMNWFSEVLPPLNWKFKLRDKWLYFLGPLHLIHFSFIDSLNYLYLFNPFSIPFHVLLLYQHPSCSKPIILLLFKYS